MREIGKEPKKTLQKLGTSFFKYEVPQSSAAEELADSPQYINKLMKHKSGSKPTLVKQQNSFLVVPRRHASVIQPIVASTKLKPVPFSSFKQNKSDYKKYMRFLKEIGTVTISMTTKEKKLLVKQQMMQIKAEEIKQKKAVSQQRTKPITGLQSENTVTKREIPGEQKELKEIASVG